MIDTLRTLPILADLSEEDLERMSAGVATVDLRKGETLFREGDPGDQCYIIQSGELEIFKCSARREVLLSVHGAGEYIGEMALVEDKPRMATARAAQDSRLLAVSHDHFRALLESSATAARTLFKSTLERSRETEARLRHSERMAQLGNLTAGVAHELNNPASAIRRNAKHLQDGLSRLGDAQAALYARELSTEDIEILSAHRHRAESTTLMPAALDPLSLSQREEALEVWLAARSVAEPWSLAATLTRLDYSVEDLQTLADRFPSEVLTHVLQWIDAIHSVHGLLAEIWEGCVRITEIVAALKSYSFLDQAPVQRVDLHRGIDDTLMLMREQLGSGIEVLRDYDPDMPLIEASGSELNQVWTNLIDNAADALGGSGTIRIRTQRVGETAQIDIEDDGPGIPAEIQHRIFDPFFTTKPIGQGTGLGLDISYGIVVTTHRGTIQVESEPGRTCFRVGLPLRQEPASPLG